MLSLILSAAIFLTPPLGPQVQVDGTDEVQLPPAVEKAITELDSVLETRIEGAIVSALIRHGELVHPAVIERVAEALQNRKPGVRKTAISVLRFMDHEEALAALVKFCKEDKRLRLNLDILERTVRAIGQYGEPSTRMLFVEPPFEPSNEHIIRARIRSLGRIRTKEAVVDLMEMTEAKGEWKAFDFTADFRLSLMMLTGEDLGISLGEWQRWWNKAKVEFTVPEELPKLKGIDLLEWCNYWELPLPVSDEEEPEHRRRGKN